MILSSFSYKTSGWELTEMNAIQATNLLVGKNAAGKTRTIRVLQNVTSYMRMETFLFQEGIFKAKMQFVDPEDASWNMTYLFEIEKGDVKAEQLTVCGKTLIKRDAQKTLLNGDIINPPKDKLVVQVRRDKEEYPDVEALMEWAEGVIAISCSDINPYTILNVKPGYINPIPFSALVEALSKDDKKTVIDEAKRLGYEIMDIALVNANGEIKLVAVKERNIQSGILDFQLSSGMIRVLYILCFLEYVKHERTHSMLLIDDLGEGLDYSRAIHLGRKVFEVCEQENMQLIASSNESFLMDVVDIAKWQIVRRNNSKLSVINQTNMPGLFDEFRMTGLSNFDLFSSDFIDNFIACSAE